MNVEEEIHMPFIAAARNLIMFVCFLLLIATNGMAQVETTDSLKTDSLPNDQIHIVGKDSITKIQQTDSLKLADSSQVKKKSPARAALYSTFLPGLGQAYNGKYWKIPIIYTIFATTFFFAEDNHKRYLEYRDAYIYFETDNEPKWIEGKGYSKSSLKKQKDFYKRNRDLMIIIGAAFYLMNILETTCQRPKNFMP